MRRLKDLSLHEIDFSTASNLYGATQDCYRHCKEETCDLGTEDIEHSLYNDDGEFTTSWTEDFFDQPCIDA